MLQRVITRKRGMFSYHGRLFQETVTMIYYFEKSKSKNNNFKYKFVRLMLKEGIITCSRFVVVLDLRHFDTFRLHSVSPKCKSSTTMPSGTAIHPDDESNTRNEWNQRARTFQNFTEENQCGIAFGCCIFFVLLM